MEKLTKILKVFILCMVVTLLGSGLITLNAQAASDNGFVHVWKYKKAQKVGKYYFKIGDLKISYSKKKLSGYKTIAKFEACDSESGHFYTDGKDVYFTDHNKMYRYTIATKKKKKLVSIGQYPEGAQIVIKAIVNGKIYYNTDGTDGGTWFRKENKVYAYTIKTGKKKLIKSKYLLMDVQKSQLVMRSTTSNKVYAYNMTGTKRLKTIYTGKGDGFIDWAMGDGTLAISVDNGKKSDVYLYTYKSKKVKKLFSVNDDSIQITKPNKNYIYYCRWEKNDDKEVAKYYKYAFSTKKATKISKKTFDKEYNKIPWSTFYGK